MEDLLLRLDVMPDRAPWYFVGPGMGIVIVLLYAIANKRLGVSGSYVQVRQLVLGRPLAEPWRVWFFIGMVVGAGLVALLRGGIQPTLEYGALGRALPLAALVPILFVGGAIAGFGARWAEGCTSGHGMSGTASRSPASWTAAVTFFLTAVAVTLALQAATGGAW